MPAVTAAGTLESLPADLRARVWPEPQPHWIEPMLATLTQRRFSSPEWIFEPKFDGQRCIAFDRRVARATGIEVAYHVFDMPHAEGHWLTELPLRARKRLLRDALPFSSPVVFTPHRNTDGEAYYTEACRLGWEGLIAKRADSMYVGRRSPDWLKLKCSNRQELVVGGFTDPAGSRVGFGALLLGYYESERLMYAGKVGTGFNTANLRDLRRRLDVLEDDGSHFAKPVRERGVHWVRPELVAEVEFTEWTNSHLRHPRFVGLRSDKSAREVVRERSGDVAT